jgi:hypothetical protein
MITVTVALALSASAGLASASVVSSGLSNFDNVEVISSLNTNAGQGFMHSSQMLGGQARTPVAGASYNGSAAWGNGAGGFAAAVAGPTPNLDTFDGLVQGYAGGAATQLGDTWSTIEFSGTNGAGNQFVQVNYFSNTGSSMDAAGSGFPEIGMAAGVGFFVAEGQDSIDVGPFTFLSATFGFFDLSGNFIGSADISGNNFSDANGLAAIGILNAQGAGIAGNIGEMFISIEYVPTPSSAALLGLGGLVAARRRR